MNHTTRKQLETSAGPALIASASRADGFNELADRIRSRDRETLAEVVRAYLRQVLRAARGAGLDAHQAEEVAQETFKAFVEAAPRFAGRSQVRTFLFGILYNKIAETRRALARDRRHDPIDDGFDERFDGKGSWVLPPRTPEAELAASEVRREIADCLRRAPAKQQMAFLLREVEGLPTEEICKVLGVTDTNLGVMLHRLRNRMRDCLDAKGVV